MPRKDFRADLHQAKVPGQYERLRDVASGDDDGSIAFTYAFPSSPETVEIEAAVSGIMDQDPVSSLCSLLLPDTSQYPRDHTYFVYSTTDNTPERVSKVLERSETLFAGLSIHEFLKSICEQIDVSISRQYSPVDVYPEEDDSGDDGGLSDVEMDLDEDDGDLLELENPNAVEEMRSDLRLAKAAGYKVGYFGTLGGAVIVSLSCRVGKLGLSQEAMQAWDVCPKGFLVLLIRYPHGYYRLDWILERPQSALIQMHVGLCDSYKPAVAAALQAFASSQTPHPPEEQWNTGTVLRPVFTGKSLCQLLNGRLINLIRYRLRHGFSWTGAEQFLNDNQGSIVNQRKAEEPAYNVPESWGTSAPKFLVLDHLSEHTSPARLSLPLLAVQYTLRRFVKCTEFCLNCYCKLDTGFEAIKPYVCSKGLCLFQYMQLGMGPSIEWEIRSQPYVVDMLISFAYTRARSGHLTDFPSGLEIRVPGIFDKRRTTATYSAVFDASCGELQLEGPAEVKVGNWLVIANRGTDLKSDTNSCVHYRVQDTSHRPRIQLSEPVCWNLLLSQQAPSTIGKYVTYAIYDVNLDELVLAAKRDAIVMLLDTLPDVDSMASFMSSGPNRNDIRPLESWVDRISPSALSALRWIVASNRSCIMYDDDPQHRVSGVQNYLQFRLAQGAPDKEQRFVNAVNTASARLGLQYPTMFAWHGSPLQNWHSILREGLHFKTIANGRSCGDGVYMSSDFHTSMGYATSYGQQLQWPRSKLNIQTAISLNEVVNAPAEFVATSSFCHVVKDLDWIQPRYLFVKCMKTDLEEEGPQKTPSDVYAQDPTSQAYGPNRSPVTIPISAVRSRGGQCPQPPGDSTGKPSPATKPRKGKTKKKPSKKETATCDKRDDDADSVTTLDEDREFLQSETELDGAAKNSNLSKTDFRLGALHESSLQLFAEPKYATSTATKALHRCLQETLKAQAREPLHELGWYIDQNLINNPYQWIVEFHSFDPSLPLAKDLRAACMTSIVMEFRFPSEFPHAPPFVRVIRPRFLPFSMGGGGHITIGGAMCMELLTSTGWSPASSIESVLLQVRMAITNLEPQPARLETLGRQREYSVVEAVEAYKRVCHAHGWRVPDDLQKIAWQ